MKGAWYPRRSSRTRDRDFVAEVEKQPRKKRVSIDVFSAEEVVALVRAAASEQDSAIFLTAAFTGLRMGEPLALRWRDMDFQAAGDPGAGELRASPARHAEEPDRPHGADDRRRCPALARLSQRERLTGPDDLVFASATGEHIDDSALRRRYKVARDRAGLRSLRFHDLRHTFGTHAIRTADPRELQEWMGHADFATTEIYLSYKPRADAARRLGEAFEDLDVAASAAPN